MNKICAYTCITGDYDNVNEIENKEKGIDYYLFTNNHNITSDTWNVIYIENEGFDNQRLSRKIKMLGHPDINDKYDVFVWMDASVVWKDSILSFVEKYLKKNNFVAFKHSYRNCIYDEANECVRMRKDTKESITKHVRFLRKEGYPENYGLCEMTVFIRRKDELVSKTMKLWFDMVCNYSKRDQLSFMYSVWKTGLKIYVIQGNVWDNRWFTHNNHNHNKTLHECRIYYSDSSLSDYQMNLDYLYTYHVHNHTYSIHATVPEDTNVIEIELTDVPCVVYSSFSVSLKCDQILFFNTIPYKDVNIFYNNKGIVRLEGNFKKGKKFDLSIDFYYLSELEKYQFINRLAVDLIIASEENNKFVSENNDINTELQSIKSSYYYRLFHMLKRYNIFEIMKYVFSAGSSFVLDLVLFTIFRILLKGKIGAYIFLATIMARVLSSLYNYFLNSRFVFKSYTKSSIFKYYVLVVVQMFVSAFSVESLSKILSSISPTIIKFFVDIIIFVVNYFVQKKLIFTKK